jgi:probable phosphoglycerate mutase
MGKIILLRHGHAFNQQLNLLAGDREFPLTSKGKSQAEDLAEYIDKEKILIDKIYCSTVERCKETIQPLLLRTKINPIFTDSLREINVGDYYHVDYENIHKMPDFLDFGFKSGKTFPSGESFLDFRTRVEKLINSIDKRENSLLVTHSGVINIILHIYYGVDMKYFPIFNIKNSYPYQIMDFNENLLFST